MLSGEKRSLAARFAKNFANNTTDLGPQVDVYSANRYIDKDQFEQEHSVLFRSMPLLVGHSSEIPNPSDFLSVDLAGLSVLVIRQHDGSVKAFANACRHRGAPLTTERRGTRSVLSCPFHGWSYSSDGSLKSISYADGFNGLDPKELPLASFMAEERHSLLWVLPVSGDVPTWDELQAVTPARDGSLLPAGPNSAALRDQSGSLSRPASRIEDSTRSPSSGNPEIVPAPDSTVSGQVEGFLGNRLDAELASYRLENYVVERSAFGMISPSNWKLTMDGYIEDYHLRYLHRRTVGPFMMRDLGCFDSFGPHGRVAPARKNLPKALEQTPVERIDPLDIAILVYQLFPNTVMVWQADHFELWSLYPDPQNHLRTLVDVRFLVHKDEVESKAEVWERNWNILMKTVPEEDWPMAESIQRNILSGATISTHMGRNEPGLQHFHRAIEAALKP